MVIHTTVTTLGLRCKVAQSAFPSMFRSWDGRRHGWSYLREMEFDVDVEECMEIWRGGVCPECQGRHIPSEGSVSRGVLWQFLSCWIMFFSILQWMSSWYADWSAQINLMELSESSRQAFSKILLRFSHVEESSGWAVPALLSWSLGSESRHPGSGSELMLFLESSRVLSEGNGWRSVAGSETSRAEKLLELGGKGWLGGSRDEASAWDTWGLVSGDGASAIGERAEWTTCELKAALLT